MALGFFSALGFPSPCFDHQRDCHRGAVCGVVGFGLGLWRHRVIGTCFVSGLRGLHSGVVRQVDTS